MLRVFELWCLSFLGALFRDRRKLSLVAEGPSKGLADLASLIETRKLVPVIDRTFRLTEVPEALRYFGEGRHKGKIAIVMGE